jgi:site-specific DNA-methyltransferase (adenine-specific)/adenine-specific DNA-methyltransferase
MTSEQREEAARILQSGGELSTEWARILFPPEKREYELVYHGKEREEDILANTMAVPLQAMRAFGKNGSRNGDDWCNMLIFGDNLQVMKSLLELKKVGKLCNADGTPGVRLVYIDPPFATKRDFRGTQDQKAYQDKIAGAQFIEFLRKRLILLRELTSADATIYVQMDLRTVHYIKTILDEVFGEQNFLCEIIWKSTSAHSDAKRVGAIHQTLLVYTRSGEWVWNTQYIPYADDYKEKYYRYKDPDGREWKSTDLTGPGGRGPVYIWKGIKRAWRVTKENMQKYEREGRLFYTSNGIPRLKQFWDDVKKRGGLPAQSIWDDKEAQTVVSWTDEGVGYPTQKSEGLLARIVKQSSNSGDLVLDAFAGSGTTATVAEKFGRRWIGIDCGKLAIYTMQKRLLNLRKDIGNRGPKLEPKPFILFNAGLYDFSKLKELSWDSWRFFALQLFQCRDERHKVGGVQLDGYLKGASVLLFNHLKNPGARFTEDTLQELHEALGTRIGTRMFIIAPGLTFDFQQDYIDLDGVRYYALRIPYSIINELHQREFTALKQPSDEMAVNDTVEAVGFDFIRTPELKFECGRGKRKGEMFDEGFIRVTTFKSEAVVREPLHKKGNLETLSTIMLDYDFDEKAQVFDLDTVFYAETLRQSDWEARFPLENIGKTIMAVFIDIYGNEARVVIDAARFGNGKTKSPKNAKATK